MGVLKGVKMALCGMQCAHMKTDTIKTLEISITKVVSPVCSFCMTEPETSIHLFHICTKMNILWS